LSPHRLPLAARVLTAAALAATVLAAILAGPALAGASVIVLTQTGCQFLEPENRDLMVEPKAADDCRAYNAKTKAVRQKSHQPLSLAPGRYTFRVTNKDVPYELGFYLRSQQRDLIPFMPRVSGGGVHEGETKDFDVELAAGNYIYSCPFNPTIDYRLTVK